jgi:hypothetical protein
MRTTSPATMAWSTTVHGDAGATVGTAVTMTVIGLGTAAPAVLCWTGVLRVNREAAAGPAADIPVDRQAVSTS